MDLKIGLLGIGSIGGYLALQLKEELVWVVDSDPKGKERVRKLGLACPFYSSIPEKCGGASLVVEAASQQAVPLLLPCLKHCDVMVMSVGAFTDDGLLGKMRSEADKHGRKIFVPSGAIGGIDAIGAVGEGAASVVLETTKPPASLGRADKTRAIVFEGSAREACRAYPKNVNVAATLSLAGVGFEKTKVRLISDPAVKVNMHRITVESDAGRMEFSFENAPSRDNPKTSALAALSAVRRIKKLGEALQIG